MNTKIRNASIALLAGVSLVACGGTSRADAVDDLKEAMPDADEQCLEDAVDTLSDDQIDDIADADTLAEMPDGTEEFMTALTECAGMPDMTMPDITMPDMTMPDMTMPDAEG